MKRSDYTNRVLIIFDAWASCSFRIGEHVGAGLPVPRGLGDEHLRLEEDLWEVFQDTYGQCTCEGDSYCPNVDLHGNLFIREHDYHAAGRLLGEINGRVAWETPTPGWVEYEFSTMFEESEQVERGHLV